VVHRIICENKLRRWRLFAFRYQFYASLAYKSHWNIFYYPTGFLREVEITPLLNL